MALSIPLTAPLTAPGTRTCLSIHSLFGRTTFTRHCRLPHFSASPWLLKNRSSLWGPFIALPQSLTSPHPYPGTYLWGAPDRTRSQEREREVRWGRWWRGSFLWPVLTCACRKGTGRGPLRWSLSGRGGTRGRVPPAAQGGAACCESGKSERRMESRRVRCSAQTTAGGGVAGLLTARTARSEGRASPAWAGPREPSCLFLFFRQHPRKKK